MKDITFPILLLGIFLPSTVPRQVQFYRKDYTYIEEYNAFYKVHWDVSGSAWSTAFFTCDDEGATLFYPKVQGEWTLMKKLTNKTSEGPNVTDIFVGLHDEVKFGDFITVEEHSTSNSVPSDSNLEQQPNHANCMTMNIHTGSFKVSSCFRTPNTALPFVCKKVDDESCPTIDRGYKYAKASKKCYKVNEKPLIWQEAMKTCFLEGGILAVIEDSAQAQDVRWMLSSAGTLYFIGVRQLNSRDDFYTVKGQKFSDLYGKIYIEGIYTSFVCGAVYNDHNFTLGTKALNCTAMAPFVCEMYV